ncbi:uncharacterized protein CDV56_100457 [Aspergillus thermomutatus]|uniref:Uncharacterized protein n=1 Tax=Aspergillus thermomutatus TaxID=41047 RepID=A0A397GAB4_ASPTH|nr:uncharacterized protein CDV56_100457 [Aspergillus thermomutatus]RHZ45040.1 hypothetical protein CDV56_100457 [Aspergillus thermomutatus]
MPPEILMMIFKAGVSNQCPDDYEVPAWEDLYTVEQMDRKAPKQVLDKRMFLDSSMSKSSRCHTPHSSLCASGAKSRRRRPTAALYAVTYALDSACAGSTSAIHLVCMSLLSRDVDMAVAGATTILSDPHSFIFLSKAGVLSETGNYKTYRDDADGYCRADFSGALVLKRLEDAVAHNDKILAVITSSARNHSGNATSITTSDANAQERLFKKVLRNARLDPDDVSYIEMHGTGTGIQVRDKAEMGAVSKVFLPRPDGKPLPAAGMSSVLKSVLMLQKGIIPPQAGMPRVMNPNVLEILGDDSSIVISTKSTEFKAADGKPKRILINNFDAAASPPFPSLPYTRSRAATQASSSKTRTPLSHLANMCRLDAWLRANPNARIQDVAYSTTARKVHHPIKFALAASTLQEAVSKLEAEIQRATSSTKKSAPPAVVFVFTGQGSHYAGMGGELYCTSPVFRKTADLCAAICASHQFPPFLDIITTDGVDMSTKNAAQVQLAVVTLQIALTAFWQSSAGIEAAMVIGHSLGEYAALHAAGVLSLTDTLYLVGQRARLLLERCEPNSCAMLSVSASAAMVRDHLARLRDLSCGAACINSPIATVISGTAEDLARIRTDMTTQDANTRTKMLSVPFAFHSFQMGAILPKYKALASGVTYLPPKIPVASTLLAFVVDVPDVFDEDCLAQQSGRRSTSTGASTPSSRRSRTTTLSGSRSAPARINHTIDANNSNWASVSKIPVAAYTSGVDVDWLALHAPYESSLELLALPTYAFVRALPYHDGAVPRPQGPDGQIQVTFRAGISDHGFMGVIDGHRIQQIGLASGTVFCDAAATVAKYALEYSGSKTGVTASHLTFHDPKLLAPLTRDLVGIDGDLLTKATVESASADVVLATFKATSKSGESYDLGSVTVKYRSPDKAQADLDRVSFFIKAKMDERVRLSKEGSGHRMQPDIFFALFANAVEFSPDFRKVQEAYVAGDDKNPTRPGGHALTYALMGYDSIEQLAPIEPDKEYLTYTRISRWEGTLAFCAAYIFEPQMSRIVMQAVDLRYQQFKKTTWRHILGTRPHAAAAGPQDAISKSVSLPTAKETKMIHDNLSAAMATVPMKQQRASKAQDNDKEEETPNGRIPDSTEIADIGVDSIMAIEVVAAVREMGVDLPAAFVFEYLTIGDLRRAFGGGGQEDADTNDTSATPSSGDEDALLSPTPDDRFAPVSPASSLVHVENEEPWTLAPELVDSNKSPPPSVRITLLQGRPKAGNTPLYMMTDGTGTVASFIHLRPFKSKQVVYGIDSPYLRCPSRMNSKVGIEGVAKLVVDALVKAHSTGPFMIGGYSVGCFVAFEMSLQLARAGRTVKGLLLIDMPCPRSRGMDQGKPLAEAEVNEAVLEGIVNRHGQWILRRHERVQAGSSAPKRPAKTAVIWAERGLVNRVSDDPARMQKLEGQGVPTRLYPGFMEDPKLSTFACHVPNKGEESLCPNGWESFYEDLEREKLVSDKQLRELEILFALEWDALADGELDAAIDHLIERVSTKLFSKTTLGDDDTVTVNGSVELPCGIFQRLRRDEWLDGWTIIAAMQISDKPAFVRHIESIPLDELIERSGRLKEIKQPLAGLAKKIEKYRTNDTRQTARKEYFHNAPVLEVDKQIKQLLGQSDVDDSDADTSEDEYCELPIPEYVFPERARLVENFYGPEAECFEADKLLARRIQVTKDMVALSQLCEPNRRGNRINWDIDDDVDDDEHEKSEEPLTPEEENLDCPTDVCIICCGLSRRLASNPPPRKFPPKRKDSLRRHLIDSHFALAHDGISCTWAACQDVPKFIEVTKFLAHAVTVHSYDVQIKLQHLTKMPQVTCSDSSSIDNSDASRKSDDGSGTETPASSVDFEMANIDPRLLLAVHLVTSISFPSITSIMSPQMEPKDVHGLSENIALENNDSRKRKTKSEDEEEAACILDELRSGERVLYLQEVPKFKASHCRAWDCMPRRRTREPIIRSYYRFALKGGTNLYGRERVQYYDISCLERIIPDLTNLLSSGCLKMDGWIAAPPDSKVTIKSSTKAIQDWFRYEGCAFDIDCYERLKKDHDEWERNWSTLQIEHQLAHTGKPSAGQGALTVNTSPGSCNPGSSSSSLVKTEDGSQYIAALAGSFPKEIFQPPINEQVDEVVFGRCCEFVYSGDYSVPLPTANPCGDDGDQPRDSKALSRGSVRRWDPLNHRKNIFHPTKLPDIYAFIKEKLDKAPLDEDGEVPNTDPADNYAGVFLSHAEVYHFAYRTDWVSLCALSLYRLIHSLASFTLFDERTGDIVRLLKFVFEESEYMQNMQDMLVDYAAWNVEILMRDADFQQLLDE